jgi:hypothetical protein
MPISTVPPVGLTQPLTSGAAVPTVAGTTVDFTGIPSWVKRITVMFNGVSTSGTSSYQIQIGSGSVVTTGYTSSSCLTYNGTPVSTSATTGFVIYSNQAGYAFYGSLVIHNINGNNWVSNHCIGSYLITVGASVGGGAIALGGTLDRLRITTVNGTDTFDAGSINILYE